MISIDIAICTFRRPHVTETLRSIGGLVLDPSWRVRVIVADNDTSPKAQETVTSLANGLNLDLHYLHAPAQNISVARNACLQVGQGDFLTFIDDDEIVTPGWLSSLMTRHDQTNAGMILGPVDAVYPQNAPGWITRGDFHSTRPVWVENKITTGYMGNVLLARTADPAYRGLMFDRALGVAGGEDTDFCTAYTRAGGKIDYAPDAMVHETIPPERLTFTWLARRRLRFGYAHARTLQGQIGRSWSRWFKQTIKAWLKADFCYALATINFYRPDRFYFWLLRGLMHQGVLIGLFRKPGRGAT